MTDEPFGRQPKLVKIYMDGEQIDIDYYAKWIMQVIENGSYAVVTRTENNLTIYPGAVND